eukprot:6224189-Ditylum_brightwellii.AAC.1
MEGQHWELTKKGKVPFGVKILDSVWAFKKKQDIKTGKVIKYKTRLNVHGGQQQYGVHYFDTYALVVMWSLVREGDSLEGYIEDERNELEGRIRVLLEQLDELKIQVNKKHAYVADLYFHSLFKRWELLEGERREMETDIMNLPDNLYGLLEELEELEREWKRAGLEGIAFDFDNM